MTAHYLLLVNPNPTESEIEEYLSGHIRRCGTYKQMIEAILECAKKQNRARPVRGETPAENLPREEYSLTKGGAQLRKATLSLLEWASTRSTPTKKRCGKSRLNVSAPENKTMNKASYTNVEKWQF